MTRKAKGPKNYCKACRYSWYPKGHSLSKKCPNCGSTKTTGCILGLCLPCLILLLAMGAGAVGIIAVVILALL